MHWHSRPTGHRRIAQLGFTLVEVLVAIAVMAILSALAWQGVDGMARTRSQVQDRLDASLTLNTALAQWEADLQNLLQEAPVPALSFDGVRLRLVRSTVAGPQVVVWSVQSGRWVRWAGAPTRLAQEISQQWQGAPQLTGREPGHVALAEGAADWQIFFFRGNAWSNAQSSGDRVLAPQLRASEPAAPIGRERLPTGVRLMLNLQPQSGSLPSGRITRDILIPGVEP